MVDASKGIYVVSIDQHQFEPLIYRTPQLVDVMGVPYKKNVLHRRKDWRDMSNNFVTYN